MSNGIRPGDVCADHMQVIWTLVPSNIAGRTKKSVASTVLFIAYCAGNSIGAQVFRAKDAPTYIPAIVVCSTMYGLEFVVMFIWRMYCELPFL